MSSDHPKVHLAGVEMTCYPQRIGYLRNRLGRAFKSLQFEDLDEESLEGFVTGGGHRVYVFLQVFYPGELLVSEHELWGYPTREAYERGDELEEPTSPDEEKGATIPEIIDAFETAIRVNRVDRMKGLADAIPFDSLKAVARAWLKVKLAEAVEAIQSPGDGPSTDSSTTTPPSPSTTSTTSDRTSPTDPSD